MLIILILKIYAWLLHIPYRNADGCNCAMNWYEMCRVYVMWPERLNFIVCDGCTLCWCFLCTGVMRTELGIDMERVLCVWNTLVCVDDKNSTLYSQTMTVVLWYRDDDLCKCCNWIIFKYKMNSKVLWILCFRRSIKS